MLGLGAFAFAAPGMLALLLALPVIYWLLRLIPPLPKLVRFPGDPAADRAGADRTDADEDAVVAAAAAPAAGAALILAVAQPLLNPQADLPGRGPLLLVIDDGWSSAPGWTTRIAHAERLIQRAERGGRTVVLMGTAPAPIDQPATRRGALRPDETRTILRAFRPKPWPTDRAAAAAELDQMQVDPGAYVVWLSDGLEDEGAARLDRTAAPLRRIAGRGARSGQHAASAAAAGRRGPRPQGAGAAAGRRRAAQGGGPGSRRAGPGRRPHRRRFRRHRDAGRRRPAGAGRIAQPHGAARHRSAGRRRQRRAARRAPSPPARRHHGRARHRRRPAAAAGSLLPRARARSLRQPQHRRSRNGADPQHGRPADPRRRRSLGQRPRGNRQVDRARRRGRALRRRQSRRRRRHAGADAAQAGRSRAGRRHELGRAHARWPSSPPTAPSSASRSPRTCASPSRCWPSRRPTSPTRPGRAWPTARRWSPPRSAARAISC